MRTLVNKGQGLGQGGSGKKPSKLGKLLGKKERTPEQQAQDQRAREEVNRWRPFGGDAPMRGGRRRNRYYDATKKTPKRNPKNWE